MSKRLQSGYCTWCAENTEHGYYADSSLTAIFHQLVRLFVRSSGYGPWYCSGCRRVSTILVPPMDDRMESTIDEAIIQLGDKVKRVESVAARADIPQASDSKRPLVQAQRPSPVTPSNQNAGRYSQKYRWIIEGEASFKQIGEELSIPKREIWGWLVEHFHENQEQIARLKSHLRELEAALEEPLENSLTNGESEDPFVSVDGDSAWSTVVVNAEQIDNA